MLRIGDDAIVGNLHAENITFPDGTSLTTVTNTPKFWRLSNDAADVTLANIGGVSRETYFDRVFFSEASAASNIHDAPEPNGVIQIHDAGLYHVSAQATFNGVSNGDVVHFASVIIHYTTDGSEPNGSSPVLIKGCDYHGWNDQSISDHVVASDLRELEVGTKLRVLLQAYANNNSSGIYIQAHTASFFGYRINAN